jgi:hypothetical protein
MKTTSFLSRAALLTSVAFLLGLAFDVQALALFSLAICVYLLLVVVNDYAKVASRAGGATVPAPRRARHAMPLAA